MQTVSAARPVVLEAALGMQALRRDADTTAPDNRQFDTK
jgi:hypothetical protein